jgi:hypothetical protein
MKFANWLRAQFEQSIIQIKDVLLYHSWSSCCDWCTCFIRGGAIGVQWLQRIGWGWKREKFGRNTWRRFWRFQWLKTFATLLRQNSFLWTRLFFHLQKNGSVWERKPQGQVTVVVSVSAVVAGQDGRKSHVESTAHCVLHTMPYWQNRRLVLCPYGSAAYTHTQGR